MSFIWSRLQRGRIRGYLLLHELWRWAENPLNIIHVCNELLLIQTKNYEKHVFFSLIKQNWSCNCLFERIVTPVSVSFVAKLINLLLHWLFIFFFNPLWVLQNRPSWIRGVIVLFFSIEPLTWSTILLLFLFFFLHWRGVNCTVD